MCRKFEYISCIIRPTSARGFMRGIPQLPETPSLYIRNKRGPVLVISTFVFATLVQLDCYSMLLCNAESEYDAKSTFRRVPYESATHSPGVQTLKSSRGRVSTHLHSRSARASSTGTTSRKCERRRAPNRQIKLEGRTGTGRQVRPCRRRWWLLRTFSPVEETMMTERRERLRERTPYTRSGGSTAWRGAAPVHVHADGPGTHAHRTGPDVAG